jgi:hypothetical protein
LGAFGVPWSTPFDDPIVLPNGRKLITLKDAATLRHWLAEKGVGLAGMASGKPVLPRAFARSAGPAG